jgi:hypothetical protein
MLSGGPNEMLEAEFQRTLKLFEDFLEITA